MLPPQQIHEIHFNDDQYPEIIKAAAFDDILRVRALLDSGTSPDTMGPDGRTALRMAAAGNFYGVAYELLKRGAMPDITNHTGRTPLMAACSCGNDEIVSLLLFYGANPDLFDIDGLTALMIAVDAGFYNVVGILIDYIPRINITTIDSRGRSALDIAITNRDHKLSRMLIAAGALEIGSKPFENRPRMEYHYPPVSVEMGNA